MPRYLQSRAALPIGMHPWSEGRGGSVSGRQPATAALRVYSHYVQGFASILTAAPALYAGSGAASVIRTLWNDETGQDLVEYALMAAFTVTLAPAIWGTDYITSVKAVFAAVCDVLAQAAD
jgi:Flp pilus assembly pilin Flp